MRTSVQIGFIAAGVALAVALIAGSAVAIGCGFGMGSHMRAMHGGGTDTSGSAAVSGGAAATVRIADFAFAPGNLQVPVGATVTWTNADSAPHDATARGGAWKIGRLSKGESASLTFDAPGDYDYYCSIHSDMKARLVVK